MDTLTIIQVVALSVAVACGAGYKIAQAIREPVERIRRRYRNRPKSDAEALRSDWEAVGRDMQKAMDQISEEVELSNDVTATEKQRVRAIVADHRQRNKRRRAHEKLVTSPKKVRRRIGRGEGLIQ